MPTAPAVGGDERARKYLQKAALRERYRLQNPT
jgi:hypothetical protein